MQRERHQSERARLDLRVVELGLAPSRARARDLIRRGLVEVAGVDRTILGSDLGLTEAPRPVDGFRQIVAHLLALQFSPADIRKLVSTNAAGLLDLPAAASA